MYPLNRSYEEKNVFKVNKNERPHQFCMWKKRPPRLNDVYIIR